MAPPNRKKPVLRDVADSMGVTRLMEAAKRNEIGAILQHVEAKHNLDRVDNAGYTALLYAAVEGHEEAALMLMFHKADLTIANRAGWNALHIASEKKMHQVIERWATMKGPLDAQEKIDNHTALMKAIVSDDIWAATRLVDAGADYSILKDKSGRTAEMLAKLHFDAKDQDYFRKAVRRRVELQAAKDKKFQDDLRRAAGPLTKSIPAPDAATFRKKSPSPGT